MRAFLDSIRIAFVSLEFLFLLFLSVMAWLMPAWCSFVGDTLKTQTDVLKWIPAIPIALCPFAVKLAWNLTTPAEGCGREMMDWPDYWRLKLRRNYSFFLSAVTAILAVGLWIFSMSLSAFWLGGLTVACLGLALINTGCMFMAALTLREIVEKN